MTSEKVKIVIVDDEEDLCFLLSGMLSAQGYEVNYFHTLKDGVAGIKSLQPNWVIIDNNLPDGLGWNKVNDIIDFVPDVNIIKISASPDSHHEKYREFVHYFIKPIDVNSIIDLVKHNGVSKN